MGTRGKRCTTEYRLVLVLGGAKVAEADGEGCGGGGSAHVPSFRCCGTRT